MPALSPTMTEGTLVSWQKKEGDSVEPGDVIAEIETDKATMEVEAVDGGILAQILVPAGTENVHVNTPIAIVLEEGESGEDLANFSVVTPAAVPSESKDSVSAHQPNPADIPSADAGTRNLLENASVIASPVARRIADKKGLDLTSVQGSGPHGRIVKKDVLNAPAAPPKRNAQAEHSDVIAAPAHPRESQHPAFSPTSTSDAPSPTRVPLSGMRKTIAARLTESKQTVPHFYLSVDAHVDALLAARADINKRLEKQGIRISVNDFVIKACAVALLRVPEANVTWGTDHVMHHHRGDVSVAVSIEGGLITPIVTDAGRCSLVEISQRVKDLAARAREGKLQPGEYQGGTFTLSNLGMYGIDTFSAILNPPQASILAVGAAAQKPVASAQGTLEIATVMNCTLSADHRALDGAVAATFLNAIKDNLENPAMMLV